jgi:hypothetical protein
LNETHPRIEEPRTFVCKFAAGNNSHALSGVWRVWTAKNKPTLFIAVEGIGQIKASVHCPDLEKPTWKRHYGFTFDAKGEVADEVRKNSDSRHKATWIGADVGQSRTLEWRIIIPESALRLKPLPTSSEIKLIAPPATNQWLTFAIILGPMNVVCDYPKASDVEIYLLSDGKLCDGRPVWVVYYYSAAMSIEGPANPHPRKFGSAEKLRLAPRELRASPISDHSDGSLVFWDLRVDNQLSAV